MSESTQTLAPSQKMYEDACASLGFKPLTVDQFSHMPEWDREPYFNLHQITTVIKARKGDKKLDYNTNDRKYFPWWLMNDQSSDAPGSGFRLGNVFYNDTLSLVGVRLSSKSKADAEDIAEVMMPQYKIWMKE